MRKRLFQIAWGLCLVLLFLLAGTDWIIKEEKKPVYQVSVLLESTTTNGWTQFQQGMDLAARQYNLDVSYVTIFDAQEAEEQMTLLRREMDNGAEGIVLTTQNEWLLTHLVGEADSDVQVVSFGNQVDSPRLKATIQPNWSTVGRSLSASVISQQGTQKQIDFIYTKAHQVSTELVANRLEEIFTGAGMSFQRIRLNQTNEAQALMQGLAQEGGHVVITTELELLESCGQYGSADVPLYGLGWSDRVWQLLEQGNITGVVVTDGFTGGFQTGEWRYQLLSGQTIQEARKALPFVMVTKETLYQDQVAQLLFPIT